MTTPRRAPGAGGRIAPRMCAAGGTTVMPGRGGTTRTWNVGGGGTNTVPCRRQWPSTMMVTPLRAS
jgi:hypothetical protein